MARNQGPLKSSLNAGELSDDLREKVGLKQFYSVALRMKNIEPVPQSGCRLAPGSAFVDTLRSAHHRIVQLPVTVRLSYILVLTSGFVDIYRDSTRAKVATIASARIMDDRLDEYEFYGEADTVGIFHDQDATGIRLLRDDTDETSWTLDDWPWESKPKVDLGRDDYPKTDDIWEVNIRYTDDAASLTIQLTVDDQKTNSIRLVAAAGDATVAPNSALPADWTLLASHMQTQVRTLPGMDTGVTVVYDSTADADNFRLFRFTFGGDLTGDQYGFDSAIVDSALASALPAHIQTGKTTFEDLISDTRGGYGGMVLIQDRAWYFEPNAEKAALALSDTGEYFKTDQEKVGDQFAIVTKLRTQTSEQIVAVVEDTYALIFTNRSGYFVNNRPVKQSEPLNFITVPGILGTKKAVRPATFDGRTWFISPDGSTLNSIQYDAVGENFTPKQEDLLATHLIARVKRMWPQRKRTESFGPRLWTLRDDGRMIGASIIADQDIAAFWEWIPAAGGLVCDMVPDGRAQMWISVQRGDTVTLEVMEEPTDNLFHCSITATTDLAGGLDGLDLFEGKTVWAEINGYIDGPFTVRGGAIQTDFPVSTAQVGLWQAPVIESMPYWKVVQDEILFRPGRVHTVSLNLKNTESIAIGANGRPPRNVPLGDPADDVTAAPPQFNGTKEVCGIQGMANGPTIVITQLKPGHLRLKSYVPGVKY
jgi:hypothetical protein